MKQYTFKPLLLIAVFVWMAFRIQIIWIQTKISKRALDVARG